MPGMTLLMLSLSIIGAEAEPTDPSKPEVLLFSYFKGNGEDGLHLAYSRDGLHWAALNGDRSLLPPEVGKHQLMRDPSILRSPDGLFHLVWTTSWVDHGIGYAHSRDLIHWSEQRFIPVMAHEAEVMNCWAPELFYDAQEGQFLIFWASTVPGRFPETEAKPGDKNHRMYYVTTRDFKFFSEARLFYEPGFNVIDAAVVRDGARYIMILKNETEKPPEKNLRVAFAEKATGPYGPASEPITGQYWAEGPSAIEIGGYWYVYFDKYIEKTYGVVRTADWKRWEDLSERMTFPEGMRHGTVFRVNEDILKPLLALEEREDMP
jgi:hypothetical protein